MPLKELEDYDWFPPLLRKYQLQFIGIMVQKFGLYRKVAEMVNSTIKKTSIDTITDLCSGSGLPAIYVHQRLINSGFTTILTDKFPQPIQHITGVIYDAAPLDINDFIPRVDTYYTMYNAFHHFEVDIQKQIIQKVIDAKANLLIVEIVQPTILSFIQVTLASTLGVWLLNPLIRPFEWKRFVLTYIIPINVLTVLIDGYISILKSKSKSQYNAILMPLEPSKTIISVEQHFVFPAPIITINIQSNHT